MLPPGRRRETGLSSITTTLIFFCLFISIASAASAVLGLDFGTLNLKAVLVKPGIPFEIVLTKDSKRKEAAAVAFKPAFDSKKNIIAEVGKYPERTYGGDALALQARLPGEVFPNLKPLIGLPSSEENKAAFEAYKARYPGLKVVQNTDVGTTLFKSAAFVDSELPWSVEELLAMLLANVKHNAETLAGKGNTVDDAVITVPAFYTADERRAIITAATLAQLNVIGLISDGLAVGLDYAKGRTFPDVTKNEKPEYHLVYDMGAGSTVATVLRFQSRTVKDVGKFNKTIQEVAVLGTGWDRTLGGDNLNNIVLTDYLYKFATKPVMKNRGLNEQDVQKNARAMSRLWKEAERSRQVLSANTEVSASLEELLPDIDFRAKLTRSEFEDISLSFANRIARPINDALAAAKLEMSEIDSIILHGGVVRTPFVQRKLEEIAGNSAKLKSNVNSDESAVFGAAFKGASLSPSFKVKEIRDSDIAAYAAGMIYTDGGKERRQVLFGATSPVGHGATTKQVTFKDKEDFTFKLYQQVGDAERPIFQYQTKNLTASIKALKDKFGCDKDEIQTKFNIKLSPFDGIPVVLGGTVSCEVEGSGKSESLGDSVKGWLGLGKKNSESSEETEDGTGPTEDVKASSTEPVSETKADTSSSDSTASVKEPEKPKKRIESISIDFESYKRGNPQPTIVQLGRMQQRLQEFERSDQNRLAREEALNVLEGFTYYVRDFLTNDDYHAVSTSAQRDDISKLLASTREFLETPSEVVAATEASLKNRLKDLKALVEPIQNRRKETLGRPDVLKLFKKSVDKAETQISKIKDSLESASSKLSSALAEATSVVEEKVNTPPAVETDVADSLEEDSFDSSSSTASTTTTAEAPPRPSTLADLSAYTDFDLTRLTEALETAKTWLEDQESAQAELEPYEDPAFSVADIEAQNNLLDAVLREMQRKKIAVPPRSSSSSKSKSKSKSKTKGKKSSTAAATATESNSETVTVTIDVDETPTGSVSSDEKGVPVSDDSHVDHGEL